MEHHTSSNLRHSEEDIAGIDHDSRYDFYSRLRRGEATHAELEALIDLTRFVALTPTEDTSTPISRREPPPASLGSLRWEIARERWADLRSAIQQTPSYRCSSCMQPVYENER